MRPWHTVPIVRRAIDPPPKRSRKCPHCRERIELRQGRLLTPAAAEKFDAKLTVKEAKQRLREGRQNAAKEIREARKSGVVAGFRPLVSDDDCSVCQAVRDKFFPVENCTPEMLPPYENCEYEDGCRATFICDLTDLNPPATPRRNRGCLGVVAVCVFISIAVWMGAG